MNIAVGWESSPGKKAPAMSFLAYYKENKIHQYRELYYRDVLTNKTSIKLPQNTKYPAQTAAYYKFAVVLCVVQMFTFWITSAGSPPIPKGNEQKSLRAAWE